MTHARIPRRASTVARGITTASRVIRNNKGRSLFITWLLGVIGAGITTSLMDLNGWLLRPLSDLASWKPNDDIWKWTEFAIIAVAYTGFVSGMWIACKWGWYRWVKKMPMENLMPTVIYEDEIAAAVEALDNRADVGEDALREAVTELMFAIAETITVASGLTSRDYRAYFVASQGNGAIMISNFWFGRDFALAERRRLSIDDILAADEPLITRMCGRRRTVSVMKDVQEEFPDSDIRSLVMIRNPGAFRMCFLIAIKKPDVLIDTDDPWFVQTSYIMRLLGFMDNLVQYVLQY